MLLSQRIEITSFSPSEKEVIDYVLSHIDELEKLTIKEITDATYTSAPIVIRACKKLGMSGYNELKKQLLEEYHSLSEASEVDGSIPFVISDRYQQIASSIAKLESVSIENTFELLEHDQLYNAISLLSKAPYIDIYANSSKTYLAEEFAYKMSFIQKRVFVAHLIGDPILHAATSNASHVAIMISYSGETSQFINIAKRLKKNNTKIILITSLGMNTLSKYADVILNVPTKEMIHTKIGDFSSSISIKSILDILYGCMFSLDYETNLDRRIALAKLVKDYDPEIS